MFRSFGRYLFSFAIRQSVSSFCRWALLTASLANFVRASLYPVSPNGPGVNPGDPGKLSWEFHSPSTFMPPFRTLLSLPSVPAISLLS